MEKPKKIIEELEESPLDATLRPALLADFVGQKKKVENLRTYIKGAKKRKEALDHVLLSGPPGLGKTTLANIIATEMSSGIKHTSGPVLEKKGDLSAILTDLEPYDVLFIDEIHRMKTALEEILYKAMEDYSLDVIIGQGVGAKSISIDLNPFTLIGATTRSGLLSSPLRDRFGIHFHLDFYSIKELSYVICRSAKILNIEINEKAAESIAKRSRGTPRVANKLLKRVRDFAEVQGAGYIDEEIAHHSFLALEVDEMGLNEMDRKLLLTIIEKFSGGPVGLSTLSTAVQEEKDTLEDVYEPYLIQQGYLEITSRGRMATEKAFTHYQKKIHRQQRLLFDK
jgi:Holliday junction DNA helicase RuvB